MKHNSLDPLSITRLQSIVIRHAIVAETINCLTVKAIIDQLDVKKKSISSISVALRRMNDARMLESAGKIRVNRSTVYTYRLSEKCRAAAESILGFDEVAKRLIESATKNLGT